MGTDEYVNSLGYGDTGRHVFEIELKEIGETEIPESCHILAQWENGSYSCHFHVPNNVLGFFSALDEAGDPSLVVKIWCSDSDYEEHIDTQFNQCVEWPVS